MRFLKKNWYVIGLLLVLVLAFLAPGFGVRLNEGKRANTAAIVIIFLISGFSLPTEAVLRGVREVRLHLYVNLFVFVVTPLYFLLTAWPFRDVLGGYLLVGIYGLACLPTTISSCIAFTQMAGGNVVGTVFNAALSNLVGVFISPLLLTLLLRGGAYGMPFAEVTRIFMKLLVKVLLPFAVGQVAHAFAGGLAVRHKKKLNVASSLMVLLIVYFAFCGAASNPNLRGQVAGVVVPLVYLALSNVILVLLAYAGARAIKLRRTSVISVIFLAPQKTLGVGAPLLATYFADRPELLGIALLPLLFYHPWQLFVAGVVSHSRLVKGRASDSSWGA